MLFTPSFSLPPPLPGPHPNFGNYCFIFYLDIFDMFSFGSHIDRLSVSAYFTQHTAHWGKPWEFPFFSFVHCPDSLQQRRK